MSSDGFYIIVDDTFGPYKHCKDCGTLWTDSLLRCPQCGSGFFKFARNSMRIMQPLPATSLW